MQSLPRNERLRGRGCVSELFEKGGRGTSGTVAARALANGLEHSRLAAVAGRKSGNAVERNRMRRRLKAAFRTQKDVLPRGYDLALLARPGLLEASWSEIEKGVREAVAKAVRGLECGQGRPRPRT